VSDYNPFRGKDDGELEIEKRLLYARLCRGAITEREYLDAVNNIDRILRTRNPGPGVVAYCDDEGGPHRW